VSSNVEQQGSLPTSWRVQLPVFEGPLDLLLHLVKINEVEITDIPVAVICDQFNEYLHLMEELNLDIAADYIYEAAQLIHLKSRLLLPRPVTENGEEVEDPRQELVERLLEYQRIKEAAQSLAEIHTVRHGIWSRPSHSLELEDEEPTIDLGDVSLYDLLGCLKTVLVRYEREHPEPLHVPRETFTVRDQFQRLLEAITEDRPYDLLADLRQRSCRAEIVAAFLAVLELAHLSLVRFHQTTGGEILIYRTARELQVHELEAIEG
jgi:segregation and condensation protein A